MDGTGPQHPLTDSRLERELESALGIEPSPEFVARVRTRIAGEPEVSMWRMALWGRGFQPLVALAVVGVVLAVVIPNLMREDAARSDPRIAIPPAVAIGGAQQVEAGPSPDRLVIGTEARTHTRAVPGTEVPLRLSKPLFAPEGRDALVVLITAIEGGRVVTLPAVSQADERSLDVRELTIEPLVLDPLPPLAELGAL